VTSVIIGSTRLSQLEDNLKAAAVTLSAAEIAELDAATALTPVYPNFFMDNIAQDRPVAEALR
jgi:aryl-alcohol dehydrogenase-like predicted oxidoreductase